MLVAGMRLDTHFILKIFDAKFVCFVNDLHMC